MTALIFDVRAAIRALASARGFTAIAVATLTVGLSLCVTVLSVINAYVVRGLPYPAADRLYRVDYAAPNELPPPGLERLDWSSLADVVESNIAWDLDVFYVLGGEHPESLPGGWVTPGYVEGFGVRAAIGRTFEATDFAPGSPAVAMISHRVWQTRFSGAPDVVGRQFSAYVSDRPDEPEVFTIVGVLPADFWHLNVYSEVLAPLRALTYPYMVRAREGVSPRVVEARIETLVRNALPALPQTFAIRMTPAIESYTSTIRPMLWAVGSAAALVLLIAGANLAVLMLVRGARRQREFALRQALGASRRQLARPLALEGLLIGGASTALALALSAMTLARVGPILEQLLQRRVPGGLERLQMDLPAVVAAAAFGMIAVLVFTVLPTVATWRVSSLAQLLAAGGRAHTEGAGAARSRAVLIAVEVAATLSLLVGAALMLESAIRMMQVDFGFDDRHVVTASLGLRQRTFPDDQSRLEFFDRLLTRLEGVGAGRSVALGDWLPLQGARPQPVQTGGEQAMVAAASPFLVTSDYFETLGIPLRDGRTFQDQDRLGGVPVVVISESLARRMWPARRAVGERLTFRLEDEEPTAAVVIGVAGDVRQSHSDTSTFDFYLSLAQRPSRFVFVYVRAPQSPTWQRELRTAVAEVHPEVAMGAPRRLGQGLEEERAGPRFLAALLGVFAMFAAVLALVGMYGVISYAVRQRQREIAVRMAIGADVASVTRMFLRQGTLLLLAGVVAGIAGGVAVGQLLQSQLHGVQPAAPHILVMAAVTFLVCGGAAIWWPARRAASIDPVCLLRAE